MIALVSSLRRKGCKQPPRHAMRDDRLSIERGAEALDRAIGNAKAPDVGNHQPDPQNEAADEPDRQQKAKDELRS
jgi:hypothetical protein